MIRTCWRWFAQFVGISESSDGDAAHVSTQCRLDILRYEDTRGVDCFPTWLTPKQLENRAKAAERRDRFRVVSRAGRAQDFLDARNAK